MPDSVTITINGHSIKVQAGTTVQFASTDSQTAGLDINRVELTVNGMFESLVPDWLVDDPSGATVVEGSQRAGEPIIPEAEPERP